MGLSVIVTTGRNITAQLQEQTYKRSPFLLNNGPHFTTAAGRN